MWQLPLLSSRKLGVLRAMAAGLSNKALTERLVVTERTQAVPKA